LLLVRVDAITAILSKELGARRIRVNSINPGLIITEGVVTQGNHEREFRKYVEATAPLARVRQPDDISPTVAYLASSDSK
jgi:3-oxoacyl-[acyl-carrier protein] reductase